MVSLLPASQNAHQPAVDRGRGLLTRGSHHDYAYEKNAKETAAAAGHSAPTYRYDASGNTLAATGSHPAQNRARLNTKPLDAEITAAPFYYSGYSYDDSLPERWPSRDPIEEEGGINLYGFVGNDGMNVVDPDGTSFIAAGQRQFAAGFATHLFIAYYPGCATKDDVGKQFSPSEFEQHFGSDPSTDGFDLQTTSQSARKLHVWVKKNVLSAGPRGEFRLRRVRETVNVGVIRESTKLQSVEYNSIKYQVLFTGSDSEVTERWKKVSASANSYEYAEHGWAWGGPNGETPDIPDSPSNIKNWPNSSYQVFGNNSNTFGMWLGRIAGHEVSLGGVGNKFPQPPPHRYQGTQIVY